MSLAYAYATVHRRGDPGLPKFLTMLAALVPGDILVVHGIILSATTKPAASGGLEIVPGGVLALTVAFWGLILASILLYAAVHHEHLKAPDFIRMLIPPAAFVGWTMLQKPTAFDAACNGLHCTVDWPLRVVIATLLGLVLIALVNWLDYHVDRGHPKP